MTMSHRVPDAVRRARRQSLGDLLHRSARRSPDKVAVVSDGVRLTYAELDATVNRAAWALADRGMHKGDRLALLSHNCWQYAVLTLATARLGVVLVPINFMLQAKEIAFILQHAQVQGMVTEDALAPMAHEALEGVAHTIEVRGWIPLDGQAPPAGWEDVDGWTSSGPQTELDVLIEDDDHVRLMYTSGTESRPKGVVLTSRSLIAQYVSCIVDGEMTSDDVEVHALPMYHCAQLDCFFLPDVYVGATSVIIRGPDPETLLRTIERERVTKIFAPPTVWISLLRSDRFATTDLSSLRKGYYGASAMPVEVLREIQRRLPDVRLWNFYGQTELAPVATILRPEEQLERAGSAGRPVLNVETILVDDLGDPVPAGVVGEIVHRSPQATLGYWRDEFKTAEAFYDGWFHSGDLGVMTDDGYLSVVDRKKDMIKTGGENVASREVEEVIYELESVAEVAVFGIAHPRWIEAVAAAVVPRPGESLDQEAVQRHCRARMAGYKVPKYVTVVDVLPKNPSGKILKRELRTVFAGLAEQASATESSL